MILQQALNILHLNYSKEIQGILKKYYQFSTKTNTLFDHLVQFVRPYNLMCKDEQFLKVNQNWV